MVRTVGIPRSFLKQIEKPAEVENDGFTDESKQPHSRWVDAEGNAVAAIPDSASWAQYQAKAQASAAKDTNASATGSKELQDRGIECSIDKRLFVDPVKTPCCSKVFCHECIETALINSDLVCPECSTEGVLLDNLVPDEETVTKIKAYEAEKEAEKTAATKKSKSPTPTTAVAADKQKTKSPSPKPTTADNEPPSSSQKSNSAEPTKKRPAEDDLASDRIPKGPAAMQRATPVPVSAAKLQQMPDQAFVEQMNALAGTNGVNGFPPMNMGMMNMPGMMGMNPQMMMGMNPMMMQQFMGMGGMNGMNGMPNMGMMNGMGGNMGMNGMPQYNNNMNMGYGRGGGNMGYNNGRQQMGMNGMNGQYNGQFMQQQQQGQSDSPYMRQPVNNRPKQFKKARPMDFKQL